MPDRVEKAKTTLDEVQVSLVWCRLVPECLVPPFGPLVTGAGYRAARAAGLLGGAAVSPPWAPGGAAKWSNFWSSYVRDKGAIRALSDDAAWDSLVPLAWNHSGTFTGPVQAVAVDAWLYPHAAVVIATLTLAGTWTVDELPAAVSAARRERSYCRSMSGGGSSSSRSLDGLASELAGEAVAIVAPAEVTPGPQDVSEPVSIVAVTGGAGEPDALAPDRPEVASCLAGLAALGPAGPASPDRLLDANHDTNLAARIYWSRSGHVIWRPDAIVCPPRNEPLACLRSNHAHAIAQVLALGSLVEWALHRIGSRSSIDPRLAQLLNRALFRLDQLERGERSRTYRAQIVAKRAEQFRSDLDAVRAATGYGVSL